ncbi:unnamed protein product [Phaedon cochleariae]|uniref:CCHC-type domain-containing protein n=1 Tax=Phaedon cochleariae TaxID=80249 RepID=A0A9P0DUM8_PHACE|nr:unnamed protein product [Phaedon cochleariae]
MPELLEYGASSSISLMSNGKTTWTGMSQIFVGLKMEEQIQTQTNINISGEINQRADAMVEVGRELKKFLLDDSNKISKMASAFILDKMAVYEGIIVKLIAERAEARGRAEECRSLFVKTSQAPTQTNVAGPQISTVQKVIQPPKVAIQTFAVAVRGDGGGNAEDVLKKVEHMSKDLKEVKVRTVRKIRDGVVIEAATVEDAENIKRKVVREKGLKVAEAVKMKPKLVILDVPKVIKDEEIVEDLFNKNDINNISVEDFARDVKIEKRVVRNELSNVVIKVTEEVSQKWLTKGYVYIGWRSCKIKEMELVKRCYKCCSVHHRAEQCRERKYVCRRCGDSSHEAKNCKNRPSCKSCYERTGKDEAHPTDSVNCPEYIRKAEFLRNRETYNV